MIINYKTIIYVMGYMTLLTFCLPSYASTAELSRLKQAYPKHFSAVSDTTVTWADGTRMLAIDNKPNKTQQEKLDSPSLLDQVHGVYYSNGIPANPTKFTPTTDPGRIRYEPFFRKMYGNSKEEVETKLVTILWMPKIFGNRYPLPVTTVNDVDKKLISISNELELLVLTHPEYIPFLSNPGGTFVWRVIEDTHRLSPHSFGMTIDINSELSNYWLWDLKKASKPTNEETALTYRNSIPWEIVPIFEKYGFIWGGKWQHYDTMHFEYRPELFIN